jgi:hypothetical protein
MVAEQNLAKMLPMSEAPHRTFRCVDAIAAVNCTLQGAIGRFERCPGASCPFWDEGECLFHDVRREVARPHVAEHLLELRDSLAAVRDRGASDDRHERRSRP